MLLLLVALATAAPDRTTAAVATPTTAPDSLPAAFVAADTLGTRGDGPGQLLEPSGVATDAFGRLYVGDAALHRLQRFDERGDWLGESGALGSEANQLRRPGDVAALGTLGVAILDRENRRVVTYDLHGRLVGVLADLAQAELVERQGRVDPVALAADRGGALYVADGDADRILAFDFSGRFLRALGGFGSRPGSFRGLAGLAVAPHGEILAAERGNARIQRLDSGGRPLGSWSIAVTGRRGALPVAVDDSARVAVADETSGTLWLFDPSGHRLAEFTGLARPRALAFAPDGTLLVAEAGAGRVRRFAVTFRAPPPAAGEE